MYVDKEQQNSYSKLEQNLADDIKRAFEELGQCCVDTTEMLRKLAEQNRVVIEEAKEIEILKQRKKNCKNYLELKQINRRLNLLKLKQGKRRIKPLERQSIAGKQKGSDRKCP